MSAEIEFENKEIKAFLKNLNTRLKDIKGGQKKYVGLISSIVYRDILSHFEQEEGSSGKWPEWSLFYAMKMKELGKGGNKILQDSGRLRNSFKPQNYRSVSEGILWFNNAQTKSGFPYALAHNDGGDQLPMRDFMWASDKAQDSIAEKTLQFMIDEGV